MLRKLKADDILAIKDDLVESNRNGVTTPEEAKIMETKCTAFTFLKGGKIVGCCGAGLLDGVYNLWGMYSIKFSPITRVRCMVAFAKALRESFPDTKALIAIPSDLCNGARYAKFFGGKFIRTEPSLLFGGITNDIYEVI